MVKSKLLKGYFKTPDTTLRNTFFFLLAYLIKLYWGRNPTKLLQHSKILPVPLQVKSYVDSIG